jgi:hypothetical protein
LFCVFFCRDKYINDNLNINNHYHNRGYSSFKLFKEGPDRVLINKKNI